MRLTAADLREAIADSCALDLAPPLIRDTCDSRVINIDGDLDLALLADILSDRLDAAMCGRTAQRLHATAALPAIQQVSAR